RPAARAVEEWDLVGAPAEEGHTEGLEHLRCRGDVEDPLGTGGDDGGLGAGELPEVGRDVERLREAAMDASDPSGAHEADPGRAADGERGAHGRRTELLLHRAGGKVAGTDLARVGRGREALEVARFQSHA